MKPQLLHLGIGQVSEYLTDHRYGDLYPMDCLCYHMIRGYDIAVYQ